MHWRRGRGETPRIVTIHPTAEKSERHTRKYAEGEVGEDKSFFFRGPEEALNLRAQKPHYLHANRRGVDDPTWLYHLKAARLELAGEVREAEALAGPGNPVGGCGVLSNIGIPPPLGNRRTRRWRRGPVSTEPS